MKALIRALLISWGVFLVSLILTSCASVPSTWVRGSERAQDARYSYQVPPSSADHARCLEKFETCNGTPRPLGDLACSKAFDYCMQAAGYRLQ